MALAFTALCGYVLASGTFEVSAFFTVAGVFLFASGSAALNQVQEANKDAKMDRTRDRPLPSSTISLRTALAVSLFVLVQGLLLLAYGIADYPERLITTMGLALGTVLLYNFVYTPLKSRTLWAIIPGAVNGASPVLIGWSAGGGILSSYPIWLLFTFMFIWQIPHFNFLLFRYGDQYKKAGFSVLSSMVTRTGLLLITFLWIFTAASTALLFPLFGIVTQKPVMIFLMIITALMLLEFKNLLNPSWQDLKTSRAFTKINVFGLCIMGSVCLDQIAG